MAVGRSEAQSALWWARRRDWALLGEPHPASRTARNPSTTVVYLMKATRVSGQRRSLSLTRRYGGTMPGIDGMGVAVWLCDDEAPRVRGAWAFLAFPLQQCGREPLPRGRRGALLGRCADRCGELDTECNGCVRGG